MTLVKWDPFKDVAVLQNRINRLFDDAFPGTRDAEKEMSAVAWRPSVDIFETSGVLVIRADLPGVNKEDVTVEIKDNELSIKGERKHDPETGEINYYRRERVFGSFSRSFNLEYRVRPENIKARFKNGILEVEIPKPEEEKPKQVSVDIE